MSKRIRNWLFIAFIVLFVLGTAFVSLYASGYKINLGWPPQTSRLLIRTGMIIVDSRPAGATVYLDGKVQQIFSLNPLSGEYLTTAAKIRNVRPGEYLLRLEKDGYWPWEKKVTVYPNQAATIADVNLFRSDEPQLLADAPEGQTLLSDSGRYLYISGSRQIISLRSNQATSSAPEGAPSWRQNADELVGKGWLLSPQGRLADYQPLIGTTTASFYDEDSGRFYYQAGGSVSYLDTASRSVSLVTSAEDIRAFQAFRGQLWLVANNGGRLVLESYSLPAGPLKPELELPAVGEYSFRPSGSPYLSLYDNLNKTLYLIDPSNPSRFVTVKGALSWQWVNDDTLLYNNNWEIFRLSLDDNSSVLLTRVGTEIRDIVWNAKRNYLIFSTPSGLEVYDPRLETITSLLQAEKISAPALDADNDLLYFWAERSGKSGAYRLLLQ